MSNDWVAENLQMALDIWNSKFAEIIQLITTTPANFKDGVIWRVMVNINGALQSIGLALLVLFFLVGVVKTCGSFAEVKKPEHVVKIFIRFAIAKAVVVYGLDLMMAIFNIIQGIVHTIMNMSGLNSATGKFSLPSEVIVAIEEVGFGDSIPLWIVSLIGVVMIIVLSFIMIFSVYGRFFKLYLYTAIAPVPLSSFAGEPTQNIGKSFLKSYAVVCLEGVIIVLACIIFSYFAITPPTIESGVSVVTQVWKYISELIFNMLVLVASIKMADNLVKEMVGH